MKNDEPNRVCSVCGGLEKDDGTSDADFCWCDEDEELEEMFSEALELTELATKEPHSIYKRGEHE